MDNQFTFLLSIQKIKDQIPEDPWEGTRASWRDPWHA